MKIRTSFVANSSSSSFIIGCSALPHNLYEAGQIWFGEKADKVAPEIVQGIFSGMRTITIEFDRLLDMATNKKWKDIEYARIDSDSTELLLSSIVQDFEYSERYWQGDGVSWSSRSNPKPIDIFIKTEEEKLIKKYNAKTIYDSEIPLMKRLQIDHKWYNKKEVRVRFVQFVEQYVNDLRGYPVLMEGEFGDDCGQGELEHGDHWDLFPVCKQFSHH